MRSPTSQWIRDRLPECAIFAVGVFLRLTMSWRYDAMWGYDAPGHWEYVKWILQHGSLPPCSVTYLAYHPPLYHAMVAGLIKIGATHVVWLSIICGVIRLALIWLGLEWYLEQRQARILALTLAAVLPSSILIDGMVSNESLNCMLGVAAMVLWPKALQATCRRRWLCACALGMVLGLGMLTKASAVVLLVGFGTGAALNLLLPLKPHGSRLKALLPWAATVAICLTLASWFYARNVRQYRNPFATYYEVAGHPAANTPYLDRRNPSFVFGWSWAVYKHPFYPVGLTPRPRYFTVVLAETFVDYYNYSFSGLRPDRQSALQANGRPLTSHLLWLSRAAVFGGTIILLATLAAWAVCLLRTFQRRDWGVFALLLTPLFATLFALSFAVKYPYDVSGVVKGVYIQFGAAPLYAMFGVAGTKGRIVLALLLLGLVLVAAYTVCCRTGLLL